MHEAALVESFQTTKELLVRVSDLIIFSGTIAVTDVAQFNEERAMDINLINILRRRMAHMKHM